MTDESHQILNEMKQIDADLHHRRQVDADRLMRVEEALAQAHQLDRDQAALDYSRRQAEAAERTAGALAWLVALVGLVVGLTVLGALVG